MLRIRWVKVLVDLWGNRGRTLIVALAIAVGVYAVGVIISVQELLVREHGQDRAGALAAEVVIHTTPFADELANRVAEIPGVTAATGRHSANVYVYDARGERKNLLVATIPTGEAMTVDALTPLAGAWPPGTNEIVLERLALDYLDVTGGDMLLMELEDGSQKQLVVAGTVHDAQQFNPEITNRATGYVTPATMERLGYGGLHTEMRLRLAEGLQGEAQIQTVADAVEEQIERSGRPVMSTTRIGEGPQEAIIDTVVFILSSFGLIILLLSGFLVVNAISALITRQLPQIGIMKLVGAGRLQIMAMYFVTVLAYGIIAVALGIPLALATARFLMTEIVNDLLNVWPESLAVSTPLVLGQVIMGLALPLLAGLAPVLKGTRVTTHKALNDTGMEASVNESGYLERLLRRLQKARLINRPYVLAIRNTMRHKARLLQTLLVLIVGTALFISVLSVQSSVNATLASFLRHHQYDVSVGLARPYRVEELERVAARLPGVAGVESWSVAAAARVRSDDVHSDSFLLYAVPAATALIDPQMERGHWLSPEGEPGVVVNSDVIDKEPDLAPGDLLRLDIAGREVTRPLLGVMRTDSQGPAIYMDYADYSHITRLPAQATHVQVVLAPEAELSQETLKNQLFAAYEEAGFEVSSLRTAEQINDRNELMFTIIVAFLVLMALLLAAVGGLGLTTTMSINILERIREIGVLRAVGASNAALRRIVLIEGVVIGLLSWLLGTLLSVPVSTFLSNQVGLALLKVPLTYHYSSLAAALWLAALMVIAVGASLGPARSAVRLTVREVLSYE